MAAESNGEIAANHSQKLSRIKQRIDFNLEMIMQKLFLEKGLDN